MPDAREVYQMVTKQKPPEPGALERQHRRQVRTARNRKIGAIGVAAVIALVAVVLILVTVPGGERATTPADEAPVAEPIGATPVEVATGFVRAYGTFDADRAITYLADDAIVSVQAGAFDVGSDPGEWPLSLSWWQAAGYEQLLDPCEETFTTASGSVVRCTFDFHLFGSDRIGRGPFTGSYWDLTVRDGQIEVVTQEVDTDGFSPQMWEPFAAWVAATHPKDIDVMYSSKAQSDFVLTEKSIGLWREHVDEYVREVRRGNAE